MELFEEISINSISKKDLLLIIQSLDYTYEKTNINDFSGLKQKIVKEVCFLTNTTEEEFIDYLTK